MPRSTLEMRPAAAAGSGALKACLATAQANAERRFGDGQVPAWKPPVDWRAWTAGAAAVVLLSTCIWWWLDRGSTRLATPRDVAELAHRAHEAADVPAPLSVAAAPAASIGIFAAAPERQVCGPDCLAQPEPPPAAIEVPWPSVDQDAWALHPELGPVTSAARFEGKVNTPDVPDENDSTTGEETLAEEQAAQETAE